ncbi:MAG: hypothetical protein U0X40_01435 [Ferruginibacter sp.]
MKKNWIGKGILFFFLIVGATFLFTWVVMALWNGILPAVLGVKMISFWQAMGILVLSKILFGGFGGKHHRGPRPWKDRMMRRWMNMTPEEREKFQSEWKTRCGHRWSMYGHTEKAGASPAAE